MLRGHRSLGRGSGPKEVTGCPLRTVVTMNCPVPSSALFLCGCFGVTPLHRNIVKKCSETDLGKVPVFSWVWKRKTKETSWKAKTPQTVLAFTMWVWSVCPEHGATTRFWNSAPLSRAAAATVGTGCTREFCGFVLLLLLWFEFGQSLWLKLSYFNRILSTHLFV